MKIHISIPCCLYEQGSRKNQEDALWPSLGQATADDRLFIVCDGMGGHDHGEVASQAVATTIGEYIASHLSADEPLADDILDSAIAEAYDQLDRLDNANDQRKMGTTLTLLCLHRGGATMAHIGDSRIYHLRPSEGRMLYISRDHSLVMDLYLAGELSREEMDTYEGRNIITRAMQPHQERRSRPDIAHTIDIQPGDLFLLCSDGVLEQLTDEKLLDILSGNASDEMLMQRLHTATAQAADNHTAYLIRILDVEREESDEAALHNEDTSRANFIVIERAHEKAFSVPTPQATSNPTGWLGRIMKKWLD